LRKLKQNGTVFVPRFILKLFFNCIALFVLLLLTYRLTATLSKGINKQSSKQLILLLSAFNLPNVKLILTTAEIKRRRRSTKARQTATPIFQVSNPSGGVSVESKKSCITAI
jgi:hypothetical protein